MDQKIIVVAALGILIAGVGTWFFFSAPKTYSGITSYEECVAAGYPVLETYPEQCKIPDGRTFTHKIKSVRTAAFNKPFILRAGDKVIFPDGLSLGLKEVNDSRCKPGVQCIWQGEISFLFSVSLGGFSEELRLGTVNNKNATLKGYVFTLQSGTAESATMVVAAAPAASGVSGIIHIGPTCPVERIPPDPACADRPYANAKVTVRSKASGSVAAQSVSDEKGNFRVALAPGMYTIDVSSPTNSLLPRCETREITVKASGFVSADVSCDSGIR